jgi:hypothetical protein
MPAAPYTTGCKDCGCIPARLIVKRDTLEIFGSDFRGTLPIYKGLEKSWSCVNR